MSSSNFSSGELPQPIRIEAHPLDPQALTAEQLPVFEKILDALRDRAKELPETLHHLAAANKDLSRYGLPYQEARRTSNVLFIDGDRGTGKSTVLVSVVSKLSRDVSELMRSLEKRPRGRSSEEKALVWPLEFIDFPRAQSDQPVLGLFVQCFRPVFDFALRSLRGDHCSSEDEGLDRALRRDWQNFQRMVAARTAGAYAIAGMGGRESAALLNERSWDLLRVDDYLRDFIATLTRALERSCGISPLFVVPVDDVDGHALRTGEMLRLLRAISHPQVFFLLAGDGDLIFHMLYVGLRSDLGLSRVRRKEIEQMRMIPVEDSEANSGRPIGEERAWKLAADIYRRVIPPVARLVLRNVKDPAGVSWKDDALRTSPSQILDAIVPEGAILRGLAEVVWQQILPRNLRALIDLCSFWGPGNQPPADVLLRLMASVQYSGGQAWERGRTSPEELAGLFERGVAFDVCLNAGESMQGADTRRIDHLAVSGFGGTSGKQLGLAFLLARLREPFQPRGRDRLRAVLVLGGVQSEAPSAVIALRALTGQQIEFPTPRWSVPELWALLAARWNDALDKRVGASEDLGYVLKVWLSLVMRIAWVGHKIELGEGSDADLLEALDREQQISEPDCSDARELVLQALPVSRTSVEADLVAWWVETLGRVASPEFERLYPAEARVGTSLLVGDDVLGRSRFLPARLTAALKASRAQREKGGVPGETLWAWVVEGALSEGLIRDVWSRVAVGDNRNVMAFFPAALSNFYGGSFLRFAEEVEAQPEGLYSFDAVRRTAVRWALAPRPRRSKFLVDGIVHWREELVFAEKNPLGTPIESSAVFRVSQVVEIQNVKDAGEYLWECLAADEIIQADTTQVFCVLPEATSGNREQSASLHSPVALWRALSIHHKRSGQRAFGFVPQFISPLDRYSLAEGWNDFWQKLDPPSEPQHWYLLADSVVSGLLRNVRRVYEARAPWIASFEWVPSEGEHSVAHSYERCLELVKKEPGSRRDLSYAHWVSWLELLVLPEFALSVPTCAALLRALEKAYAGDVIHLESEVAAKRKAYWQWKGAPEKSVSLMGDLYVPTHPWVQLQDRVASKKKPVRSKGKAGT